MKCISKEHSYSLVLFAVLFGASVLALRVQKVEASGTIYIRADGSVEGTTYIASNDNITYVFTTNINDSVVVERNNTIIDGNGYTLKGSGVDGSTGFRLTRVSNVTIKKTNISIFLTGIYLSYASNNTISENNLTLNRKGVCIIKSYDNIVSGNNLVDNWDGVYLELSADNAVSKNHIVNNTRGIYLNSSLSNLISGNYIEGSVGAVHCITSSLNNISSNTILSSDGGVDLYDFSDDNIVLGNSINDSWAGVDLINSSDNSIFRNNITGSHRGVSFLLTATNTIMGNIIRDNFDGIVIYRSLNSTIIENNLANNSRHRIYLDMSFYGKIYHNNFIGNGTTHLYFSSATWDSGYPSGGNYWSEYNGTDLSSHPYQNETGSDGIGDSSYGVNRRPQTPPELVQYDNYPLMGPFHSFNTFLGKPVNIVSNSVLEGFECKTSAPIRFYASNMTSNQTHGFCRVSIPYEVMSEPFNVTIDGVAPTCWNYTLYDNGTHRWLYFEYEHTTREVMIIPEFPFFAILPLFMTLTLLTTLANRRKHTPKA